MSHPPKHRWLSPSRHDPWNRVFARYAGILALAEWVLLFWWLFEAPVRHLHPVNQCLLAGVTTLLGLIGIRGVVSIHRNPFGSRFGSFILLATNGLMMAVQLLVQLHPFSWS